MKKTLFATIIGIMLLAPVSAFAGWEDLWEKREAMRARIQAQREALQERKAEMLALRAVWQERRQEWRDRLWGQR